MTTTNTNIATVNFCAPIVVDGVPVIEVHLNENTRGYLCPFRSYRFQVCGNEKGHLDLGSTEVIGLKHAIVKGIGDGYGYQSNVGAEGVSKEILMSLATVAIINWMASGSGAPAMLPELRCHIMKECERLYSESTVNFSHFIDMCYDYLR